MAMYGVEVHLIVVGDKGSARWAEADSGMHVYPVAQSGRGAVGIVRRVAAKARTLVRELDPDVVYVRPFPLGWVFLLRHLRRAGVPYVLELNTLTAAEFRSHGQPLKGRLYEWFDGVSIRHAAGIVTVTDEISAWAIRISGVRKPTLVAGNGVDLERLPPAPDKARANVRARLGVSSGTLVLAMAGFASPSHGFDRAIAMLAHLERDSELWLIGTDSPDVSARAKEMARELNVSGRLRVFPRLDPAELAELLGAADIGVGALAIDRKGMAEAQPIKVRLYLAYGLPVLYNHRDPKLDGALSFVSYVPSTEPRDLAAGVAKLRDLGSTGAESAREFAVAHLSWAAVAAETRQFLSQLVGSTVS
jgi:glycosyltransferase involved in cell wall biosynthesis